MGVEDGWKGGAVVCVGDKWTFTVLLRVVLLIKNFELGIYRTLRYLVTVNGDNLKFPDKIQTLNPTLTPCLLLLSTKLKGKGRLQIYI